MSLFRQVKYWLCPQLQTQDALRHLDEVIALTDRLRDPNYVEQFLNTPPAPLGRIPTFTERLAEDLRTMPRISRKLEPFSSRSSNIGSSYLTSDFQFHRDILDCKGIDEHQCVICEVHRDKFCSECRPKVDCTCHLKTMVQFQTGQFHCDNKYMVKTVEQLIEFEQVIIRLKDKCIKLNDLRTKLSLLDVIDDRIKLAQQYDYSANRIESNYTYDLYGPLGYGPSGERGPTGCLGPSGRSHNCEENFNHYHSGHIHRMYLRKYEVLAYYFRVLITEIDHLIK